MMPEENVPPNGPPTREQDLSLRGVVWRFVGEVLSVQGRLPKTLGRLFRSPGSLTRAELDGERESYSSPLQLYLVANLIFFLVGPALGLFNFQLRGFLGISWYAAVVHAEIARLGVDLQVYASRFDTTIRFRQPTFVFILVPGLAMVGKAVLPRRLFGEHLIFFTDFFAWLLFVAPAVMIGVRLLQSPLSALLGEEAGAVLLAALLLTILAMMIWYLVKALRSAFALPRWRAWLTALASTAGLVLLVVVYAHFLFWSTVLSLHFG